MALRLVVYDPPIPGMPHLAVALEMAPTPEVVFAAAHDSAAEAEAAIIALAARLEAAREVGAAA